MFWEIKIHNSGYILAHAMQILLDKLPSTVKLRIRTSQGHSVVVRSEQFAIAQIEVVPHRNAYTCRITKTPDNDDQVELEEYVTGMPGPIPWPYLAFGERDVTKANPALD
jgi:hypothetical protein